MNDHTPCHATLATNPAAGPDAGSENAAAPDRRRARMWLCQTCGRAARHRADAYSRSRQPVAKIQRMMAKQITTMTATATSDTPTGTSASPKKAQRKPEIR